MDRLIGLLRRMPAGISLWWVAAASCLLGMATPVAAKPCSSNCLTPGDYNMVVNQAGTYRSYRVHVPANYSNTNPTALVLDIHGLFGTDQGQRADSGQLAQSDKRGFIAVWPQGLNFSWNGYVCCGSSYDQKIDDVGFLRRVVGDLVVRANIDPARVYATGLSNGALMNHRLACEAADLFSAVAPVSFTRNAPNANYTPQYTCHPSRPVTVVEFHGTADDAVPYSAATKSSSGNKFQYPPDSLVDWAKTLGCASTSTTKSFNASVTVETYAGCRNGVTTALVTVTGGPHDLYGDAKTKYGLDIADYIWTNVFR